VTAPTVLKSLPSRLDGLPDRHPPEVVQGTVRCHDPKEMLLQASPPALRQPLPLGQQDPRKRLLAALREVARDCDLDGVGLASALFRRAVESAGEGLLDLHRQAGLGRLATALLP
jgi:hypothetical protein